MFQISFFETSLFKRSSLAFLVSGFSFEVGIKAWM